MVSGDWTFVISVQVAPLSELTCHWWAVAVDAMVVNELVNFAVAEFEATKFEVVPDIANPDNVKVLALDEISLSVVNEVFDPLAIPWLKL